MGGDLSDLALSSCRRRLVLGALGTESTRLQEDRPLELQLNGTLYSNPRQVTYSLKASFPLCKMGGTIISQCRGQI